MNGELAYTYFMQEASNENGAVVQKMCMKDFQVGIYWTAERLASSSEVMRECIILRLET